jgi:hypothetical protein
MSSICQPQYNWKNGETIEAKSLERTQNAPVYSDIQSQREKLRQLYGQIEYYFENTFEAFKKSLTRQIRNFDGNDLDDDATKLATRSIRHELNLLVTQKLEKKCSDTLGQRRRVGILASRIKSMQQRIEDIYKVRPRRTKSKSKVNKVIVLDRPQLENEIKMLAEEKMKLTDHLKALEKRNTAFLRLIEKPYYISKKPASD